MKEFLLFLLLVLVLFGIVMLFFVYMPYESIKTDCERIIKEVEERELGLEVRFYDNGWLDSECQVKAEVNGQVMYLNYYQFKASILP
jgi:hypothetical protein